MGSPLKLALEITGNSGQLTGELKKAQHQLTKTGSKGKHSADTINRGYSAASHSVGDLGKQFASAKAQLVGYLSASALINVGQKFTQDVIAVQDLRTRMQSLTASAEDYATTETYLVELGDRHHKNVNTLTDSFSKLLTIEKAGITTRSESIPGVKSCIPSFSWLDYPNEQTP